MSLGLDLIEITLLALIFGSLVRLFAASLLIIKGGDPGVFDITMEKVRCWSLSIPNNQAYCLQHDVDVALSKKHQPIVACPIGLFYGYDVT